MIIPEIICQHMNKLKDNAKRVNLNRHAYLYFEKDVSDTVYILERGMVMLTKLLPDGQEVGIIMLSGKNLFGHCEVLSKTRREHQAMALTQCILWEVNSQSFLHETQHSSQFALALACLQNERLRHVEQHIGNITQNNVTTRLTKTILQIALSADCGSKSNPTIKPCPTHQDLATMIASTRETVSSIMGKLRKNNIIAFDRRELTIINEKSLIEFMTNS